MPCGSLLDPSKCPAGKRRRPPRQGRASTTAWRGAWSAALGVTGVSILWALRRGWAALPGRGFDPEPLARQILEKVVKVSMFPFPLPAPSSCATGPTSAAHRGASAPERPEGR